MACSFYETYGSWCSLCRGKFVWFVWSVWFFWLNETNQMNQINQINKTNQIDQIDLACLKRAATETLLCRNGFPAAY